MSFITPHHVQMWNRRDEAIKLSGSRVFIYRAGRVPKKHPPIESRVELRESGLVLVKYKGDEVPEPEHGPSCDNPWCPLCYVPAPQIAGDGNYSP